jgi:hypothetical protein
MQASTRAAQAAEAQEAAAKAAKEGMEEMKQAMEMLKNRFLSLKAPDREQEGPKVRMVEGPVVEEVGESSADMNVDKAGANKKRAAAGQAGRGDDLGEVDGEVDAGSDGSDPWCAAWRGVVATTRLGERAIACDMAAMLSALLAETRRVDEAGSMPEVGRTHERPLTARSLSTRRGEILVAYDDREATTGWDNDGAAPRPPKTRDKGGRRWRTRSRSRELRATQRDQGPGQDGTWADRGAVGSPAWC